MLWFLPLPGVLGVLRNVVIVGKAGMGKSTLFNNLLNAEIAEIGVGHIGTTRLQSHPLGRTMDLWDTPGFFDGRISAVEILKQIETQVGKLTKLLLVIKVPMLGFPGRQGTFPDIDIVELLYAALGRDDKLWKDLVSIVFTFSQWESEFPKIKDMVKTELNLKRIPVPGSLVFAGDDPESSPAYWPRQVEKAMKSPYWDNGGWKVRFRFESIDGALLGNDELSIEALEAEKRRIEEEEARTVREYQAAVEAARQALAREEAELEEMEREREEMERKMEEELKIAKQQALELRRRHFEEQKQARFRMRVEEAKNRLVQDDLNDLRRKQLGEQPECWCEVELMQKLRRMTIEEELAYVRSLPKESMTKLFLQSRVMHIWRSQVWRIPDDIRAHVLG
jgi:energy-coupling factor transporter ATP-binding protein EcfA2